MRNAFGLMLASVVAAVAIAGIWFWASSPRADAAAPQTIAARKAEPLPAPAAKAKDDVEVTASLSSKAATPPAPAPAPVPAKSACANSRCARRQPHRRDRHHRRTGLRLPAIQAVRFPADKEVVLTFDDGPWPTTPSVLKTLADECTKAVFFPIGLHTTYHPEILKQVYAAGHTVGSHTWSHAHLDSKKMTKRRPRKRSRKALAP